MSNGMLPPVKGSSSPGGPVRQFELRDGVDPTVRAESAPPMVFDDNRRVKGGSRMSHSRIIDMSEAPWDGNNPPLKSVSTPGGPALAFGYDGGRWPHGARARGLRSESPVPMHPSLRESRSVEAFQENKLQQRKNLYTRNMVSAAEGPALPEVVRVGSLGPPDDSFRPLWISGSYHFAKAWDGDELSVGALPEAWKDLAAASPAVRDSSSYLPMDVISPEALARDHGMSQEQSMRLYRVLRVYTIGFHELVYDLVANVKNRQDLLVNVWKMHKQLWETALQTIQEELNERTREALALRDGMDKLVKQSVVHVMEERAAHSEVGRLSEELVATRSALEVERTSRVEESKVRARLIEEAEASSFKQAAAEAAAASAEREAEAAVVAAREEAAAAADRAARAEEMRALAEQERNDFMKKVLWEEADLARLRASEAELFEAVKRANADSSANKRAMTLLQGDLYFTKNELDKSRRECEETADELRRLDAKAKAEAARLQAELAAAEADRDRLAEESTRRGQELTVERQRAGAAESTAAALKKEVKELGKFKARADELAARLERKRGKKRAYKAQWQEGVELLKLSREAQAELQGHMQAEAERLASEMQTQSSTLHARLQQAQQELDACLRREREALSEVSRLEARNADGTSDIAQLRRELEEAGARLVERELSLHGELREERAALSSLEDQLKAVRRQLQQAEEKSEYHRGRKHDLKGRLKELEESSQEIQAYQASEIARLRAEVSSVKSEKARGAVASTWMKAFKDVKESEKDGAMADMVAQMQELQASKASAGDDIANINADLARTEQERRRFESEAARLREEVEDLSRRAHLAEGATEQFEAWVRAAAAEAGGRASAMEGQVEEAAEISEVADRLMTAADGAEEHLHVPKEGREVLHSATDMRARYRGGRRMSVASPAPIPEGGGGGGGGGGGSGSPLCNALLDDMTIPEGRRAALADPGAEGSGLQMLDSAWARMAAGHSHLQAAFGAALEEKIDLKAKLSAAMARLGELRLKSDALEQEFAKTQAYIAEADRRVAAAETTCGRYRSENERLAAAAEDAKRNMAAADVRLAEALADASAASRAAVEEARAAAEAAVEEAEKYKRRAEHAEASLIDRDESAKVKDLEAQVAALLAERAELAVKNMKFGQLEDRQRELEAAAELVEERAINALSRPGSRQPTPSSPVRSRQPSPVRAATPPGPGVVAAKGEVVVERMVVVERTPEDNSVVVRGLQGEIESLQARVVELESLLRDAYSDLAAAGPDCGGEAAPPPPPEPPRPRRSSAGGMPRPRVSEAGTMALSDTVDSSSQTALEGAEIERIGAALREMEEKFAALLVSGAEGGAAVESAMASLRGRIGELEALAEEKAAEAGREGSRADAAEAEGGRVARLLEAARAEMLDMHRMQREAEEKILTEVTSLESEVLAKEEARVEVEDKLVVEVKRREKAEEVIQVVEKDLAELQNEYKDARREIESLKTSKVDLLQLWTGHLPKESLGMPKHNVTLAAHTVRLVATELAYDKVRVDVAADSAAVPRQAFADFVYASFIRKFGVRAVAERHLYALFRGIEEAAEGCPRVRVFGSLCEHPACPKVPAREAGNFYTLALSYLHVAVGGPSDSEVADGRSEVPCDKAATAVARILTAVLGEGDAAKDQVLNGEKAVFDRQLADKKGFIDVDAVLDIVMSTWLDLYASAMRRLKEHVKIMEGVAQGKHSLTYAEFKDVVKSADDTVSDRGVKSLYRSASGSSSVDVMKVQVVLQQLAVGLLDVGGTTPDRLPTEKLVFDDYDLVHDSWESLEELVMEMLTDLKQGGEVDLKTITDVEAEVAMIRQLLPQGSTVEQRAALRAKADPAWQLYRRVVLFLLTTGQRVELLAMERRNQERALKSRGPGGSVARPAPSVDPGAGEPLSVFALCFGKP